MPGDEYVKKVYDGFNHAYGADGVVQQGVLTSSFDDFKSKMQDSNYAKKVYEGFDHAYGKDGVVQPGVLTSSFDQFYSQAKPADNYPKESVADKLLGKVENKPVRGDMATLPNQPDTRVEKLVEALPAMRAKKIKEITRHNLTKQAKIAPEGSEEYNREKKQVTAGLKEQDWMPSFITHGLNKQAIDDSAIKEFSFSQKESEESIRKKIDNGEYLLEEGKVKVKGGFGENLWQSLKDGMSRMKLYLDVEGAKANRNTDAEAAPDIAAIMEEHFRNKKWNREIGANDFQGHSGRTVGEVAPYVLPGILSGGSSMLAQGAAKVGLMGAAESLAGFAAATAPLAYADIPMMGLSGGGANHEEIWGDPSKSNEEKAMEIINTSKNSFMIGALQQATFHGMHAGEAPVTASSLLSNYAPTAGLKRKFAQRLFDNYKTMLSTIPSDLPKVAAIGATAEGLNMLNRAGAGMDVDFSKVPEAALNMAVMDLVFKAPKMLTTALSTLSEARKSGYDKANPTWYNSYSKPTQDALNALAAAPEAIYNQAMKQLDGHKDPNAANAKLKIETFRNYYKSLPAELSEKAKAKALHILQLKTEAIADMRKSTDLGIRGLHEEKAATYDAMLKKLVKDGDIDEKKEPLLLPRFAASAPIQPKEEQKDVPTEPEEVKPEEAKPEEVKPEEPEVVPPAAEPVKPAAEPVKPANPEREPYSAGTIADFNGKEVRYKGERGTLHMDEGGKVTVEVGKRIYELPDAKGNHKIEDHGLEEPKHVVTDVTNDAATVNDVRYNIHTDEKGNVVAISPFNNPKQRITNESMVTAVEIERNKVDVKDIHTAIDNNADHVEKTMVESGLVNQAAVNGLLNINMTDTVDKAIDKLHNGGKLTQQEALQVEMWGNDAIERLSKHDDEGTKETQEGIFHILEELHKTTESDKRTSTKTDSEDNAAAQGEGTEKQTETAAASPGEPEAPKPEAAEPVKEPEAPKLTVAEFGKGKFVVSDETGEPVSPIFDTREEAQAHIDNSTTTNTKENAVSESSTEEVLQREPEETGSAGGERGGVEQEQQGSASTGESPSRQEDSEGDGEPKEVTGGVSGEDNRKRLSAELDEQVNAKEQQLIKKQQADIDKAKDDLAKVKKGDAKTIASYVKKSGYKLITKQVIADNQKSKILKGREGDYYHSTGASIRVKTAQEIATDAVSAKAKGKAKGSPAGRNDYYHAYNALTKLSKGEISPSEARAAIENAGLAVPKDILAAEKQAVKKSAIPQPVEHKAAKEVVKEVKALPLTHVSGLNMGTNQTEGTYLSTEKGGNRYDTGGQAKKATVSIEKPLKTTWEDLQTMQNEVLNENKEQFDEMDFATYKVPSGEFSHEDLTTRGTNKVAKLLTDRLKGLGYDSVYMAEGETQEGQLIVFDRSKVKFEGEAKKPKAAFVETDRQKKVNSLLDAADRHNKMRKNSPERAAALNDLKIKAEEVGLQTKIYGKNVHILSPNGKKVQRRFAGSGREVAFDVSDYKPETADLVQHHTNDEYGFLGLAIQGEDGRLLDEKQRQRALDDIKNGRHTALSKAVYDSFQDMVDKGHILFKDSETGQEWAIPIDEYVEQTKQEKPLTDKEISELNTALSDDFLNTDYEQEDFGQHDIHSETEPTTEGETDAGTDEAGTVEDDRNPESQTPTTDPDKETGELKRSDVQVTIHERPGVGESPIYKVTIGGKDRFIQRSTGMNPGDTAWYELVKRGKEWESPNGKAGIDADGHVGDTKEEAISSMLADHNNQVPFDEPITNKQKAKAIAAKWDAAAKKVAGFKLGGKESTQADVVTAVPAWLISRAIHGAARLIEAGGSIADAVVKMVEQYKGFHDKNKTKISVAEITRQVKSDLMAHGLLPQKDPKVSYKTAEAAVATKMSNRRVTTTEKAGLRKQIKDVARGFVEGLKEGITAGQMAQGKKMAAENRKQAEQHAAETGRQKEAFAQYKKRMAEKHEAILKRENDAFDNYKKRVTEKHAAELEKAKNLSEVEKAKIAISHAKEIEKLDKEHQKRIDRATVAGFDLGKEVGVDEGIITGVKAGVKRGAEIVKEAHEKFYKDIVKYLKAAEFAGKLSATQAKSIANRAAKVNGDLNKMSDFLDYVDKVVEDSRYDEKISNAKALQKHLAKLSKGEKVFSNNVDILNAMKRLRMSKLRPEDLDTFIGMMQEYKNSHLNPTKQAYEPFNTEANAKILEGIQNRIQIDADNALINKAEEASGVLFLSVDEAKMMLEALAAPDIDQYAANLSEAKEKDLTNALMQRIEYSQMSIRNALTDSDYIDLVHPRSMGMLEKLANYDFTGWKHKDIIDAIKTMDNALLNGTPAKMGLLAAKVHVHENMPELLDIASKHKIFDIGNIRAAVEDMPVLMKAIYGVSGTVSEVRRRTGFDKVFDGGAIAKKATIDLYKDYAKFTKDNGILDTPEDVLLRGMYAHAIQHEGGTPEEMETRFENNKKLIKDSIDRYAERKSTQELAKTLQGLYDKHFEKHKTIDDLMNHFKAIPDELVQREMYKKAIEHDASATPQENQQKFDDNKAAILNDIKKYSHFKSSEYRAKQMQAIYDTHFKPFQTIDDLQKHFAPLKPNDPLPKGFFNDQLLNATKANEYFQNVFENMQGDLKFITEAYHNEFYEGNTVNYTPRGYNFVDVQENHPPGEPAMRFNNYVGKPPQPAQSITRTVEKNLPAGMALDFSHDFAMLKAFKNATYDIHTTEGQFVFSEFMKDPNSAKVWGGGDNKAVIKTQYQRAEQAQAGNRGQDDAAAEILHDLSSTLRNLSTSAALGGFTAYAKQMPSVAVKVMGTLGKDAGLLLQAWKVNMDDLPLLQKTSIIVRGENMGGASFGDKNDVLRRQQIATSTGRAVTKWFSEKSANIRNATMLSLEHGDVTIAKRSFLAFYMKYMKDNGVVVTPKDLPTEHLRMDEMREKALAYAQNMIDEAQVVSNSALMSDFKRPSNNWYKDFFKSVLLPFNTFASNTRARFYESTKFAIHGDSVQRKEAIRDLWTNAAEIVAYQAINTFILQAVVKYPLHALMDKVFGIEDSTTKTFSDRMLFEWKKFYSYVIRDGMVSGFGGAAEGGFLEAINQAGWFWHNQANPDAGIPKQEWLAKNAPMYTYNKANPGLLDRAGSYGIWPSAVGETWNDSKAAITGIGRADNSYINEAHAADGEGMTQDLKQITELGKDVTLTTNERWFMFWRSSADIALLLGGMSDADIRRIAETKKREILQKEGKVTKTSKALYRSLRHRKSSK
jgi:hypothetical protein